MFKIHFCTIIFTLVPFIIISLGNSSAAVEVPSSSSSSVVVDEDDKYYNELATEIANEVKVAKTDLINQAKVIEVATKNYATAKVKQNLFKALRGLAEKELEQISMQDRLRQPRQDDEDGGDDEEASTQRVVPLIPVVANVLKAVFGGSNDTGRGGVNLTYHLEQASKIISRPFDGITNLLGGLRRPTATESPIRIIQVAAAAPLNSTVAATSLPITIDTVVAKLVKSLRLYNENSNSNAGKSDIPVGHIVEDNSTRVSTTVSSVNGVVNQTSTTEEPPLVGVIYIDDLTKDVQEGLDGLIQAMPDLFQGAREAITLINNLRELIDE